MKHLSLAAVGLAVALSVGAQTMTDEQQQPTREQKAKTKTEENVQPGQTSQSVQPKEGERTRTNVEQNTNQPAGTRTNREEKIRGDERHSGARVDEHAGTVSHSTTVFRNGSETQEHLDLHRMDCQASHGDLSSYGFAKEQLAVIPPEKMRPAPLVTGHDLIAAGYTPGPRFKEILSAIEDGQLEGRLQSKDEAMQLVAREFPRE